MSASIPNRPTQTKLRRTKRPTRDAWVEDKNIQIDTAIYRQRAENKGRVIGSILRVIFVWPFLLMVYVFKFVAFIFEHIQAIMLLTLLVVFVGFVMVLAYFYIVSTGG